MITNETIYCYVDGTLSPDEQAGFAAMLDRDPELAARVETQQRLSEAARESFARDLDEPSPNRWIAMIDAATPAVRAGKVQSLAAHRERRAIRWKGWQVGTAAAASLVVGVVLGRVQTSDPLMEERNGIVLASAPLKQALDQAHSGVPLQFAGNRALDIRLSLKRSTGDYCREAVLTGPGGSAGHLVACRKDGEWQVEGLVQTAQEEGAYQTVAGDGPLDSLVDAIGGQALDAENERSAIIRGWTD